MPKLDLPPEERKRRSDLAKRLRAEGKLGAPRDAAKGGRTKAERLNKGLADKLAKDVDKIYTRLVGIIENGADREAITAIKTALQVSGEQEKIEREEERELEKLEQAELVAYIVEGFRELVDAGRIDLGDVVEGEYFDEAGAIGPGEADSDTT